MKLQHGFLTDRYMMSQIGSCSQVYNVFLTLMLTQS